MSLHETKIKRKRRQKILIKRRSQSTSFQRTRLGRLHKQDMKQFKDRRGIGSKHLAVKRKNKQFTKRMSNYSPYISRKSDFKISKLEKGVVKKQRTSKSRNDIQSKRKLLSVERNFRRPEKSVKRSLKKRKSLKLKSRLSIIRQRGSRLKVSRRKKKIQKRDNWSEGLSKSDRDHISRRKKRAFSKAGGAVSKTPSFFVKSQGTKYAGKKARKIEYQRFHDPYRRDRVSGVKKVRKSYKPKAIVKRRFSTFRTKRRVGKIHRREDEARYKIKNEKQKVKQYEKRKEAYYMKKLSRPRWKIFHWGG